MKKKSGCFRSVLVIICVFVVAVIFRACTLKVSAAPVMLTPEQTLALYGTEINASYYNSNTGTVSNISFEFMNFTDSWTTLSQVQEGVKIGFKSPIYNVAGVTGEQEWMSWAKNSPGLVYFSRFGIGDFASSNTSSHANIYIEQSIDLTNLSAYRQYFWYSGWVDSTGAWSNPQNTYVNYRSTFSGEKKVYAMHNNAFQLYNRRYTYGIFPAYNRRDLSESTEFENSLAYMYGIKTNFQSENSETFDITGCDYTLNGCQTVDLTGLHFSENNTTYIGKYLVLIIGCPELDGQFIGPTMPTTTPTTTVTTQLTGYTGETIFGTYSGIGLDGIATDIQEIINNQRWQIMQNDVMIQNGRRTNDNLSIIIEQLNRIYTNMLANGDISPELVQARQLDTIPPDIAGQIQTVLRGTWPTMPSNAFGDAPAVFGEMFDLFRDPVFSTIFYLGVVSLALSVAGWFLFKGRN